MLGTQRQNLPLKTGLQGEVVQELINMWLYLHLIHVKYQDYNMSKLSSKFLREINKYLNNLNLEKRDLLNFCKCFKQLIALKVHFLPDLFVMMGIFISLQSLNAHFHLVKWKTRSLQKGDRGRKFKRYMLGCPNGIRARARMGD